MTIITPTSPKKTKKILVSGIAPSNSGAGRLMKRIVPHARQFDFSIVCRRQNESLRKMLEGKCLLAAVKELAARKIDSLIFLVRTLLIRNSKVLFMHPQSTGFEILFKLIKTNQVYFYVMDNSFFCLRSYNNHPVTHTECLICVNNSANALSQCMPFPVNYPRSKNIEYLKKLKIVSKEVFFLAQNEKQKELLQMHFGNDIHCAVVGLDTGEVVQQPVGLEPTQSNDTSYDLVFHGAVHLAKGVGYFIELANLLPEYSCFLPSSRRVVEHALGKEITTKNIVFDECTWETGLKNAVKSAKLVINPSLWSSPIEGALLKSISFNGNVAVVETQYGFSREVASGCNILMLPLNTAMAAQKIRQFLEEGADISKNTKTWLNNFLLNNDVDNILYPILDGNTDIHI